MVFSILNGEQSTFFRVLYFPRSWKAIQEKDVHGYNRILDTSCMLVKTAGSTRK